LVESTGGLHPRAGANPPVDRAGHVARPWSPVVKLGRRVAQRRARVKACVSARRGGVGVPVNRRRAPMRRGRRTARHGGRHDQMGFRDRRHRFTVSLWPGLGLERHTAGRWWHGGGHRGAHDVRARADGMRDLLLPAGIDVRQGQGGSADLQVERPTAVRPLHGSGYVRRGARPGVLQRGGALRELGHPRRSVLCNRWVFVRLRSGRDDVRPILLHERV